MAFAAVFDVTSSIVEAAGSLKPEWRGQWSNRGSIVLPPKYELIDDATADVVRDIRFANALLQRNRWKSRVEPLFDATEEPAWTSFRSVASTAAPQLLAARDQFSGLFLEDERDWLDDAIEQLDDAWRMLVRDERDNLALERRIAQGAYLYVYLAIQIAERFIERIRMEYATGVN